MKNLGWGIGLARMVLIAALAVPVQAMPYVIGDSKPSDTKYKTPEDMLNMVPVVGQIPRTFLWGDGYKIKLNSSAMQIDHRGYGAAVPTNHNWKVCLSYMSPVAFFGSQIDLPIMEGGTMEMNAWSLTPLGSYTVLLSKNAPEHPSVTLNLSARF